MKGIRWIGLTLGFRVVEYSRFLTTSGDVTTPVPVADEQTPSLFRRECLFASGIACWWVLL